RVRGGGGVAGPAAAAVRGARSGSRSRGGGGCGARRGNGCRKQAGRLIIWFLILKSVSQSVFCGTSTYCVLNTVPPIEDDHGNSNSSHVKIFLPKKLLECLPKCSSLPKERHRWNTNERS
uniref:Calmodulin binding transcription activator 1 n=1 Tax=Urocitellus parryii TaxID=9999 RepID=A0A8D2HP39_UROPR